MPEKPKTQKETIDLIYYGLYGTNGSIGLIERVEHIEERPKILWKIADHVITVILAFAVFLFGKGMLDK